MKRKASWPFGSRALGVRLWLFAGLLACLQAVGPASALAGDEPRLTASQTYSAPFARAWHAILEEAGLDVDFVSASPGRLRRMFTDGIVLLDCCTTPAWRTRPQEEAVQVWSDTFYISRDSYVFAAGKARPIHGPEDLADMKVAVVLGYDYVGQEHFGARIPGQNFADVLALVAAGRADVGIIGEVDFRSRTRMQPGVFELGDVHLAAEQKVRLHRSVAYLLPRINAAIARLKAGGRLEAIMESEADPDQPAR